MQIKLVALFLIQGSQSIMIKRRDFKTMQWWNTYKGDCFSIVKPLLIVQYTCTEKISIQVG